MINSKFVYDKILPRFFEDFLSTIKPENWQPERRQVAVVAPAERG